jgi:glycosyltransferase involved in cell wall biosynthesis
MSPLWLDMSPTVINRTAIYHIARDTAQHLACVTLGYRFGTDVLQHFDLDAAEQDVAREKVLQHIRALGRRSAIERARRLAGVPARPVRRDRPRMLLFDPLYTLFEPIDQRDIVFVLDLTTLTHPEWHHAYITGLYIRAFSRILASGARIVSISSHTTASLRANFGLLRGDIFTVPLYTRGTLLYAEATLPSGVESGQPFVLFVGSLEIRKNVVGLVEAFDISGLSDRGLHLVIAGGEASEGQRVRDAVRAARNVHLLGFVSDGELRWLYENALAFAYPSYLEGFGVPILEALSFGLPVLGAITGAIREITGSLAILVDPYDLSSIADGLLRLVDDAARQGIQHRDVRKSRAAEYSQHNYVRALSAALGEV